MSLKKHFVVTVLIAIANINKALSTTRKGLNHHGTLAINYIKTGTRSYRYTDEPRSCKN